MADRFRPAPVSLAVDVEVTLAQSQGDHVCQSFAITTDSDGTIQVASDGRFPKASWRELRKARVVLQDFVVSTGQTIVVKHSGRELAKLSPSSSDTTRWSIRWMTIFRGWFLGS